MHKRNDNCERKELDGGQLVVRSNARKVGVQELEAWLESCAYPLCPTFCYKILHHK